MDTLDWTELAGNVMPNKNRIPYEPNKHLFRKVAFDVFQLNSSPVESLWILEEGDDGQQFLVAQYGAEEDEAIESKSSWEALSDKEGKNVTLMYKNTPIQRFASTDYGFNEDDVHLFQKTLVESLDSNGKLVSKLLGSQSHEKVAYLTSKFPELESFAADLSDEDRKYLEGHGINPDYEPPENFSDLDLESFAPTVQDKPDRESADARYDKFHHMIVKMVETFWKEWRAFEEQGDSYPGMTEDELEYVLNGVRQEIR